MRLISRILLVTWFSNQLLNTVALATSPSAMFQPIREEPSNITNLSSGYPKTPYHVVLPGEDASITIWVASKVRGTAAIKVTQLCQFIQEFSDQLEEHYLDSGYVPRIARDWLIDTSSYT